MKPSRLCANCGRKAPASEQMYTLRVEMRARVEPLVFSASDMAKDAGEDLQALVKAMEKSDPQEAMDQVHEEYRFDLCSRCRKRLHVGFKAKAGEQAKKK